MGPRPASLGALSRGGPSRYLKAAASPSAWGKAVAQPGASASPRKHSVFQL